MESVSWLPVIKPCTIAVLAIIKFRPNPKQSFQCCSLPLRGLQDCPHCRIQHVNHAYNKKWDRIGPMDMARSITAFLLLSSPSFSFLYSIIQNWNINHPFNLMICLWRHTVFVFSSYLAKKTEGKRFKTVPFSYPS